MIKFEFSFHHQIKPVVVVATTKKTTTSKRRMVLYFETSDGFMVYMGEDKYVNEKLIKYGFPEDVWFHVDDLSSAHVYLRLKRNTPEMKQFRETGKLDHIPIALKECCQLVKANSIEGSKTSNVSIVYTPWENLKKTGDMQDGQVGFKELKAVVTVKNIERDREVLNKINKTKTVLDKNDTVLMEERDKRDREVIARRKEQAKLEEKMKLQEKEMHAKQKYEHDYARLFEKKNLQDDDQDESENKIKPTVDTKAAVKYEEDFM